MKLNVCLVVYFTDFDMVPDYQPSSDLFKT